MKFELRPARPADVEAIMQVMADAMANLQHPEWFVPDDAVYMAEHISGPKGFCLVAEEKTTGALAAYFTVKLAGTAPDALGWQLGMSEEELNTTAQMDSCCVAPPYAAAVTATFWQPCTRIMPPACTPACTAATPLRRTM